MPVKALRSQTAAGNLWVAQSTAFLRRRFALIAKTTVAIIRLKSLVKRSKSKKSEGEGEEELPTTTPTPMQVRCEVCNRVHDLSNVPDVVRVLLPPFEFPFSPGIDFPVTVRRKPTYMGGYYKEGQGHDRRTLLFSVSSSRFNQPGEHL
jgi:hypothetical protein